MIPDPTDPDTFETDEEEETVEHDVEAPEADAAEQQAELLRQQDVPMTGRDLFEADPADTAEQSQVVEWDEDDEYR